MKTKFNNEEVAHIWASQAQEEGHGSNFFFNKEIIYSYGSHFPVAVIYGEYVLFTTDTYSNTTACHKSMALSAVSHKTVIHCNNVKPSGRADHYSNLDAIGERVLELCLTHKKARKIDYTNLIEYQLGNMENYCQLFKIKPLKRHKVVMETDVLELANTYEEKLKKEQANRERAYTKQRKKYAVNVKMWKNNELANWSIPRHLFNEVYLRISKDGKEIETSRGAKVPILEARTLHKGLKANVDLSGRRIGYYTINSVNKKAVTIGCHRILISEIERVLN